MRAILVLALMALPARAPAWEASFEGGLCVLTHAEPQAAVRLTYDPTGPLYAITVTLPGAPWPEAPLFAIEFRGPRGLTITTDRHVTGGGGASLTVTDRGFGNVLNGLEFNETATATSGAQAVSLSLDGAAPEVRRFRDCATAPSV